MFKFTSLCLKCVKSETEFSTNHSGTLGGSDSDCWRLKLISNIKTSNQRISSQLSSFDSNQPADSSELLHSWIFQRSDSTARRLDVSVAHWSMRSGMRRSSGVKELSAEEPWSVEGLYECDGGVQIDRTDVRRRRRRGSDVTNRLKTTFKSQSCRLSSHLSVIFSFCSLRAAGRITGSTWAVKFSLKRSHFQLKPKFNSGFFTKNCCVNFNTLFPSWHWNRKKCTNLSVCCLFLVTFVLCSCLSSSSSSSLSSSLYLCPLLAHLSARYCHQLLISGTADGSICFL